MMYINITGKMSGPVIYNAFKMYDILFNHIEAVRDKLYFKRQRWKTVIYKVL